jgi:hypothetical protein
MLYAASRNEG